MIAFVMLLPSREYVHIVAHYMAVSNFTHGHRGLSVQGVFESPQHEITTKYEFQISQSTKGKFYQSNELTSLAVS